MAQPLTTANCGLIKDANLLGLIEIINSTSKSMKIQNLTPSPSKSCFSQTCVRNGNEKIPILESSFRISFHSDYLSGMGMGMHSDFHGGWNDNPSRNGGGMVILPFRNGIHSSCIGSEREWECIPVTSGRNENAF